MTPEEETLLTEQLSSGSALEVLLRGHLWVEAELIHVLEEVLPFPEHIDLARLRFNEKVALAAAHGFIRPDDIAAYRALNALRNRAAHDLTGEPDEQAVRDLKNSLGAHLRHLTAPREGVQRSQSTEWRDGLELMILAMCVALDVERKKYGEHREQVRYANRRLREAAQRYLGPGPTDQRL